MMDYQEAIQIIRKETCGCPGFPPYRTPQKCHDGCMYGEDKCAYNTAISAMQELEEYKQLGTLEEVREAVDKQKEERPIKVLGTFGGEEYECKNCGSPVEYLDEYCRCCGQKLDWSEEE